jgi:hypothetical protein
VALDLFVEPVEFELVWPLGVGMPLQAKVWVIPRLVESGLFRSLGVGGEIFGE